MKLPKMIISIRGENDGKPWNFAVSQFLNQTIFSQSLKIPEKSFVQTTIIQSNPQLPFQNPTIPIKKSTSHLTFGILKAFHVY